MKQFKDCRKPLSGTKTASVSNFRFTDSNDYFLCLLLLFSPTYIFTRTTHTDTHYIRTSICSYVYAYIFNNILQQLGVIFFGPPFTISLFLFLAHIFALWRLQMPVELTLRLLSSLSTLQLAVVVIYFHINVNAFFFVAFIAMQIRVQNGNNSSSSKSNKRV